MATREWTQGNDAGPHQAPVTKLVLHTTEGSSIEGACAAYKTNNSWPHLTVDARHGRGYAVCGHLTWDVAARALKNVKGGVETNTAGVIQVEVVGSAKDPGEIDWAWIGAEIVAPICRETGIPVQSSVTWVAYPDSYGQRAAQRLTGAQWTAYAGILGHEHVPENDHGDPGAIPIQALLDAAGSSPSPEPEDEMTDLISFARDPRDGGVYLVFATQSRRRLTPSTLAGMQGHWAARGADANVYDWNPADLDPIPDVTNLTSLLVQAAAGGTGEAPPAPVAGPYEGTFTGAVTLTPAVNPDV